MPDPLWKSVQDCALIYLWNPSMKRLKKLPAGDIPVLLKCRGRSQPSIVLGFGFAPRSGDHRVVKLLCERERLTEVEIYSLASDSWRRIKTDPLMRNTRISEYDSEVFFKGSIYWLAHSYGRDRRYSDVILRFELEKERFEERAAPALGNRQAWQYYKLVVVNGLLVALKYAMPLPGTNVIHVRAWIKKESESESSSWVDRSVDLPKDREKSVLKMTEVGHLILEGMRDRRIFSYDCYCDGNDLSFKLRDLGFHREPLLNGFFLVPITTETLFLLDQHKKKKKSQGFSVEV